MSNASFVFLPHSLLKVYARNSGLRSTEWAEFGMMDILSVIYNDIKRHEMFDPTNPDILILFGYLKTALKMTYLHRSELHCPMELLVSA